MPKASARRRKRRICSRWQIDAYARFPPTLDRARLVESHRTGREVRYRVQPGRLAATARGIEAIAVSWDRTLAELKRIAEETEPR